MSRGVVLRFAPQAEARLLALWGALAQHGVPSLASHTHGMHVPHVSLVVAQTMEVMPAVEAVKQLAPPPKVRFEAVGYFPQGVLHLAAVPTQGLLNLQREAVDRLNAANAMTGTWAPTQPGAWSPHVTLAYNVPPALLAQAVDLVVGVLPLTCSVSGYWVEDGDSGESWQIAAFP